MKSETSDEEWNETNTTRRRKEKQGKIKIQIKTRENGRKKQIN